jgi:hypothetical protein
LKFIALISILFFLISCDDKNSDAHKVSNQDKIVKALNNGDHDQALALIKNEDQNHPNTKYWTAQAYSLKAGVDIYSLFPIMKMQLFDVAINEWNTMNKYAKRGQDRVTSTVLGAYNAENIDDMHTRLELIKKIPLSDVEFEIEEDVAKRYVYTYDESDSYFGGKSSCSFTFVATSELFDHLQDSSKNIYKYGNEIVDSCDDESKSILEKSDFRNEIKLLAIQTLQESIDNIKSRKELERIIKIAYAFFDSINVIKNSPELEQRRTEHVYTSLDLLVNTKKSTNKDERLGRNTRQHIGLLAGFLVLGSLKNSINLEEVNEPSDILCQIRPKILVDHYPHLRKGMLYLLEVAKDTELFEKNKSQMQETEVQLNEAPEYLNDKEQDHYIDEIEDIMEDYC